VWDGRSALGIVPLGGERCSEAKYIIISQIFRRQFGDLDDSTISKYFYMRSVLFYSHLLRIAVFLHEFN
jgi:hypothetical protein